MYTNFQDNFSIETSYVFMSDFLRPMKTQVLIKGKAFIKFVLSLKLFEIQ